MATANSRRNLKIIGAGTNLGIPSIQGSELAPNFISEKLKLEFDEIVGADTTIERMVSNGANVGSSDATSNIGKIRLLDYLSRLFNVIYKEFIERDFSAASISSASNLKDLITVIGGDHSIAIATWQAAIKKYYDHHKFAIIWIDSHLDSHNFETTESGNMHGMPIATLLGHCKPLEFIDNFDHLSPKDIYILGVRDYEAPEKELLQKLGVTVYYMDEVKERSFATVMDEIANSIHSKGQHFGISLDLDYFDPNHVSGVNTAVEGGGSVDEVVQYFTNSLAKDKMEIFELVEFNHNKDDNGNTLKCIAQLLEAVR